MCKENWKLLTDDLDEDGQILAWFHHKQIAISCTVRFARASGVKLYHPLPEPPDVAYQDMHLRGTEMTTTDYTALSNC